MKKFKNRGITLVEVLIVLSIIATLFSIAFPFYKRFMTRGAHMEAKSNLALTYQKQHTYFVKEHEFHPNLSRINIGVKGKLRYNIAADWNFKGETGYRSLYGGSQFGSDICKDCCVVNNKACCMDALPFQQSSCTTTNKCYGGELTKTTEEVLQEIMDTNYDSNDYVKSTESQFKYFAFGCDDPNKRKTKELDLWSIDDRKLLTHMKTQQ